MQTAAVRRVRNSAAIFSAFALAACADSPIAPIPSSDVLGVEATAAKPPLDQTLEGEVWICKEGTGPATNFTFAVSIDGAAATNHTVANGDCAQIAAYPVTPGVQFFHTFSVTELATQDWTLNSAIIESNIHNPAVTYQPVINLPNAQARVSHDWGLVFTFTNTYTPPPPPGPSCTLTQGYWKNHEGDWNDAGDGKPFLTSSIFYNSGVSYLTILTTAPKGGNAYLQLAHQFIAASLNTNGAASGNAAVDAALAGAAAYFAAAPAGIPDPTGALRTQLQGWATTLDNFNNGLIGPGHCDD